MLVGSGGETRPRKSLKFLRALPQIGDSPIPAIPLRCRSPFAGRNGAAHFNCRRPLRHLPADLLGHQSLQDRAEDETFAEWTGEHGAAVIEA